MIKHCTDPTFLGTAVYVTSGAKTLKLSHLRGAEELPCGAVVITTANSTYRAEFTDARTRAAFVSTCATIGRLK